MNSETVGRFARYIEDELGIVYAESNYYQLKTRLDEICQKIGVPNVEELWLRTMAGLPRAQKQLLLDVATNNETLFFRDPSVFALLRQEVIPKLLDRPEGARIWCAACSFGQEALSLAMMFREVLGPGPTRVRITGTDISSRALARATEGTYSKLEIQRGLDPALAAKYFRPITPETFKARDEILGLVNYEPGNLLRPLSFASPFDLVFCRNVLIYQSVPRKKEIVARVAGALAPGGWLVLGAGEGLVGLSDDFETVHRDGAILYRKRSN